jgi:glutathione S-transferase
MLTLIHRPKSRSGSIVWLLEEIGVPYEIKIVTIKGADGSGARDPANPHPHGKVPALVHDGHTVFEGSAIALYLTDLFPDAKLGPRVGDPKRGEYLSWLAYRPGVMEPAFIERRFGIKHVYGAMGWAPPEEVEEVVNAHLSRNKYFLGDEFSAVEYAARITDRPAFRKMMDRDTKK